MEREKDARPAAHIGCTLYPMTPNETETEEDGLHDARQCRHCCGASVAKISGAPASKPHSCADYFFSRRRDAVHHCHLLHYCD